MKWEIPEEKLIALKDSINGCIKTEWLEASNIPGVKYYLKIYPNGNCDIRRRQAWIFLYFSIGKEVKLQTDYQFFIDSAGWSAKAHLRECVRSDLCISGWGETFCATDQLISPRLIVNGKLTIHCQGILKVERKTIAAFDDEHKWKNDGFLGNILNGTRQTFAIVVGDQTLQVSVWNLSMK